MFSRTIYSGGAFSPSVSQAVKLSLLGPGVTNQFSELLCLCRRKNQNVVARPLSTSSVSSSMSQQREAKMFRKMVSGAGRAKRKNFNFSQPASEQLKDFGFLSKDQAGKGKPMSGRVRRRIDMLNNLFVEQITSLLGTGEVSPEFMGLGLQISRVKTTADFSAVNVYWYATGTEKDDIIDQLLQKTAGHLRHVLSQLRVIGIVPPIRFHKDTTYSKLQEVDFLLTKCDLGEDFRTPSDSGSGVSASTSPTPSEEEEEIETLMRQDMLGVRHDVIMNEIVKRVQQKQERKLAKERQLQMRSVSDAVAGPDAAVDGHEDGATSSIMDHVEDHRKRQFEFLKYLKQRRAEKEKILKRQSEAEKEKQFYSSEREDRRNRLLQEQLKQMDFPEEEEEDDEEVICNEEEYYRNQRDHFKEV